MHHYQCHQYSNDDGGSSSSDGSDGQWKRQKKRTWQKQSRQQAATAFAQAYNIELILFQSTSNIGTVPCMVCGTKGGGDGDGSRGRLRW